MRVLMLLVWTAAGTLFYAWHAGPGRDLAALDRTGKLADQAAADAAAGRWAAAAAGYDEALETLPADRVTKARELRLERAKVRMSAGQLPEARSDLGGLVDELRSDPDATPELKADARRTLAVSQYYVTWLLRLEGEPAAVWEPEIESARQIHRLLAEEAEQAGRSAGATEHREDVEATIRLARMDLAELQALKLPSQCCGCKSGACKSACKSPGKKPAPAQEKKDARGASSGQPPDDGGH
jgi:hypothetical protein